jgi:glycosyltransferase involved in cell wall biosynthesis
VKRAFRLAYLVSHPIQYQASLLRKIAAHPDIDLTVFFLSDISVRSFQDPGFGVKIKWDVSLLDGYRHVFLPCLGSRGRLSFWRPLVYGLTSHFRRGGFDAIWLHGYAREASLRAFAVAKRLGIKVLLRGEGNLICQRRPPAVTWLKSAILQSLFSSADALLAIGEVNRHYYRNYGVSKNKIFLMPYAVDNSIFQKRAAEAKNHRDLLRGKLGLRGNRSVILFAGKFQQRKRAQDLLEAYIKLSIDGTTEPKSHLLFIGDGEERSYLEDRVKKLGWNSVKFLGFKNQSELPIYYDLCDVFVLVSEREPWGLTINEVMNAGKAVIVSDQVGCASDLVRDGENGFVIPVGDIDRLSQRLRQLVSQPDLTRQMGQRSLEIISDWNFEADLRGLLEALQATVCSHI